MRTLQAYKTYLSIMLVSILGLSMTGCNDSSLFRQADEASRAADRIESVLNQYEPDEIEDSELVRAIVGSLPEAWQGQAASIIGTAANVRVAAAQFAGKLDEFSDSLRVQAEADATETQNAVLGVMSWAELALGTNGLLASIAGLFWGKKRKAERGQASSHRLFVDTVTSIDAAKKANSGLKEAFNNGAGASIAISMAPETIAAVALVRNAT